MVYKSFEHITNLDYEMLARGPEMAHNPAILVRSRTALVEFH